MKLFEKCTKFLEYMQQFVDAGLYPFFRMIESAQDTEVYIGDKKMLMMGSNDYMGLTNHPKVKEAAKAAVDKYGTGCAGSRFLNGTLDIHVELEERLAEFVNKEKALCFTTGFQVNVGSIPALIGRGDYLLLDKSDHASIIDGARLGFGKIIKFNHNDMEDLERVLKNCGDNGKLIVMDGIYSMEGDIANLPKIVDLAKQYEAAVMVDDAHSIGVLGERGNGTASHFGLDDEVDLIMGTFSKSLASIGGFIAGDRDVIEFLKHEARALIFSASMAPACTGAALAALDIIINEPERREKLWENTRYMQKSLEELGYDTGLCETPIIPVHIGEIEEMLKMWRYLHDKGIFVNPVVPPAVPPNRTLIRVSLMATHTKEQMDRALENFAEAGKLLQTV